MCNMLVFITATPNTYSGQWITLESLHTTIFKIIIIITTAVTIAAAGTTTTITIRTTLADPEDLEFESHLN